MKGRDVKYLKTFLILFLSFYFFQSCTRGPKDTGYEFMPNMVYSVAYEAYSENPVTKDGKTMLMPPKNSISRGNMPFHYEKGEKEAIRAGKELRNPYQTTKESLVRGKHLYDNYCLVCHGARGKGDGPLIPKFPSPPGVVLKKN